MERERETDATVCFTFLANAVGKKCVDDIAQNCRIRTQ